MNDNDTIAIRVTVRDDGTIVIRNLQSNVKQATTQMKSHFDTAAKSVSNMGAEFLKSAGIFASTAILVTSLGAAVKSTATAAIDFNSKWTQVRTIVDESKVDIKGLEKGVLDMAGELGSAGDLARGTYMVISSMQKPQTALQDLAAAAKFAQGGQADLNDSVKAGTGIMNAFGEKAKDLNHVYDVLWQVISDGVTTAKELAPAIGRITPMAEAAGLSIEEMAGSIAVMTQISQNTNETITSLRGILTSVLKPTTETAQEAERLGINFSAAAIKTMGFSGWLADMNTKVIAGKGDMAKLFPSVEALGGILQLTRNDLSNFNTEMENMSKVTGNNERAHQKWKESFQGAWSSIRNEVEVTMMKAILPAMKDLAKWLSENGKEITAVVKGLVSNISSTIGFITKFHDVIILAGKAWLVYFAVTKVTAWSSAFSASLKDTSGFLGIFASELKTMPGYFSMLRSEGMSTGKALKASFSTFGDIMKSYGYSVSDLGAKIKALPTAIKIGIAFVLADIGLGWLDKLKGYLEEKTGFKYKSPGEFLGKFSFILDAVGGPGQMLLNWDMGTMEYYAQKSIDNVKNKFKLSLEEMKILAETFDIKLKPMDMREFEANFRGAMGQVDALKAKFLGFYQEGKNYLSNLADSVLPHFQSKIKEVSTTTAAAVSKENQAYSTLKATVAGYTTEELEGLLAGYKESKTLTDSQIKSIQDAKKEYEDMARAVGVLSKEGYSQLGKEVSQFIGIFKSNYNQFKDNNKGVLEATKLVQEWTDKYKNAGKEVPAELETVKSQLKTLLLLTSELTDADVNFDLDNVLMSASEQAEILNGKIEGSIFVFESYRQQVLFTVKAIALLTNNTALYTLAQNEMNKSISTATINENKWGASISTASQKIELALNIFNGMVSILETLGVNLDSTTQGLVNLGNAAGQIATALISHDPVALVGGIVNAIGSIIDIFKKERDWAGEANALMGNLPGVTQEITNRVAELGKELGSVRQAFRQLMGDIIQDTVTSKKSFEAWAAQVMSLFNYIGRYETTFDGKVISYEGVENLNEAFQALVDKVDEFGMRGSKAMIDIIRRAQELGLEVESISNYVNEQLTGSNGLIDSFNKYVNSMLDNDAWLGVIDENSAFLDTQVQAMVAALTKQGYSYFEIAQMLGDSLTTLGEKAAAEGTQLPEYLRQMTDLSAFITQNQTLIDNIEATRGMMEALGNTNNMTKESFKSFLTQGLANYQALKDAGGKEIDNLRIMAPYLRDLQTYAETYGLTIDAQTQALIDQANANDLLTDSTLTDSEKQITLLETIVELLGGKIPYAIQGVEDTVSASMDNIQSDVETWNSTLNDVGDTIETVGGKITDLDNINHEKIISNTIVADTETWLGKLIEIDDQIFKIIDTVTVGDTVYRQIMNAMSESTEQLILGTDGVVRSLRDIIALQGQVTAGQVGGNYGVYTQEQRVQNSLKFHQLAELWSSNRSTILGDKSWMSSFYRDLYALRGGVLQDEMGQFNTFLTSITNWNTRVQDGWMWDEVSKKWFKNPGAVDDPAQAARGLFTIVEQGYPETRPGKNIGVHTDEMVRVWTAADTAQYMSQGFVPAFDPRTGNEVNTPSTIFDYFNDNRSDGLDRLDNSDGLPASPDISIAPIVVPAPSQSSSGLPREITIRHEVTIRIEGDAGGRIEIDEKELAREILELVEDNSNGFTSKIVRELEKYQ